MMDVRYADMLKQLLGGALGSERSVTQPVTTPTYRRGAPINAVPAGGYATYLPPGQDLLSNANPWQGLLSNAPQVAGSSDISNNAYPAAVPGETAGGGGGGVDYRALIGDALRNLLKTAILRRRG